MKKTIVFIICLGHSGSTLIGNILDSHSKGLHIGEIPSPLTKGYPVLCRSCLNLSCPIWGNVLTDKYIRKVFQDYKSKIKNPSRFKKLLFFSQNYSADIYTKLFEEYPYLKFIVDSSKNLTWYSYNTNPKKYDYKYIFLKRDLKAIYASLKRQEKPINFKDALLDYYKQIKKINKFYTNTSIKDKIFIDYERFCKNPEYYVNKLTNFLGIQYEEKMLNFQKHKHHLIGGNTKLLFYGHNKIDELQKILNIKPKDTEYYKNLEGIKLDDRWKNELTKEEINYINNYFNKNEVYIY